MADTDGAANGVSVGLSREQSDASDRAAFLSGNGDGETDEKAAPVETADSDEDTDIEDVEVDDVEVDDDAADEDDVDDLDKGDDENPERVKLLDAARRREQRSRDALTRERKSFETERDAFIGQWKPRIEAVERFEALKAKINPYNAPDILIELGLSQDDLEEAGRGVFAMSKTGAADPKNKEIVAQRKAARDLANEVRDLKKWKEEQADTSKRQAEEAEAARHVEKFLDGVTKAAPAGTLSAHFLEKDPKQTRDVLGRVATKLWEKTGERPTPKAIHAAYNKFRAKQLQSLGVDPASLLKTKPADPKRIVVAAAGKKAPTKKADEKPADDDDEPLTRESFMRAKFD